MGIKKQKNEILIRTKWFGFEETESTWEPIATLYQDVPDRLREYLDSNPGIPESLRLECLNYINQQR